MQTMEAFEAEWRSQLCRYGPEMSEEELALRRKLNEMSIEWLIEKELERRAKLPNAKVLAFPKRVGRDVKREILKAAIEKVNND
jgi:hypothetical protein